MKVDVVILTKNSLKPCLAECVRSVYANVPVNRLIVVDGGSSDGTVEFLSKFPNVLIIDDSEGNRASARRKGVMAVETEWFMFVDSDVVLSKDWFRNASSYIDGGVGAIQGIDINIADSTVTDYAHAMNKLRKIFRMPKKSKPAFKRAFTGDVLIRTEAIKNIKIPKFLHFWEDQYIRRYIERNGYRWLTIEEAYCFHHKTMREMIEDAYPSGYCRYLIGEITIRRAILNMAIAFPKSFFAFMHTPSMNILKQHVKFNLLYSLGALKAWAKHGGRKIAVS